MPGILISLIFEFGTLAVATFVLGYVIHSCIKFGRQNNYSPAFSGPKADFLIGHARIMPREYEWKTLAEWKKKIGDVIQVHVLNKKFIILNSLEAIRDLLDKRGLNYSDRPRLVLFQELMGWDTILAFLRYGERFRRQRKLMQQHWNIQSIMHYRPIQRAATRNLLVNLLQTPENFEKHIGRSRAISEVILMTTYGYRVDSNDDPYVHLVETVDRMTVSYGSPGATIVDFIPVLKYVPSWFPGAGFKRHGLKTISLVKQMIDIPFEKVRKERAAGLAKPSFVNSLLDDYEKSGVSDFEYDQDMKAVAANIYGAGVETTITTLLTFVLAMVLNPSIARKAQQEIDAYVGSDRLPDFDDRQHLPYLDCILHEIHRWNPPLPLSLPHAVVKKDNYRGKSIPAGAMVIPNVSAVMRDPERYPRPESFDPDRFLGMRLNRQDDADAEKEEQEVSSIVFGFGRRICPGRFFADAGIWLTMGYILACFNILPPLDEHGNEVVPLAEFTSGTTSQPKPFHCRFVLRNSGCESIIQESKGYK